jgi:hypothetical protein
MDRRQITAHEIFRDVVSVGTLITLLTATLLIGRWIGANDQKWVSQGDINIEQNITNRNMENNIEVLKQWKVASTQKLFFGEKP